VRKSLVVQRHLAIVEERQLNQRTDLLLSHLRGLLHGLGKDGGLIGPSIYDTAQVLRLAPPGQGSGPALDWLITQQRPDGGWGNQALPRARDVPTLAAVLALHAYPTHPQAVVAARAGLAFLRRHAVRHWLGPLPEDLPVGVELLLPQLLDTAMLAGLDAPWDAYAPLHALGDRRRRLIARQQPQAGTSSAHSWEAWGDEPISAPIDGSGSVGHSPAATAAWLHMAAGYAGLAEARTVACRYLEQASAATGVGIPGVVPTVWPITRFEHVWSLYPLCVTDLFEHPDLRAIVHRQLTDLAGAIRPLGIGMSDDFMQDGDITATAIATLKTAGLSADAALLRRFQCDDHFYTYPDELQLSLTTTAHAVHALALSGADVARPVRFLVARQAPDGRWLGDKWHSSWLYTTAQIMIALAHTGHLDALPLAVAALLRHQHADGSWGVTLARVEETAHAVHALLACDRAGLLNDARHQALCRAASWLVRHCLQGNQSAVCWIGKELYRPHRVARTFEISATLACVLKGYGLDHEHHTNIGALPGAAR
jgi:Squalene-hopene cyclase C-terminal domain/Prenyltransferase and squalene oxidase repeat